MARRLDYLITYYFLLGLEQLEICWILHKYHNIIISDRSIRRHLKRLNLSRRKKYSSIEDVINFLQEEIQGSGQLHGYRWMYRRCIQSGVFVKQITLRLLLKELDPIGVAFRKRNRLRRRRYNNNGPNHVWHVDSYDKLKPYGICINGCIDGFSRKIIWLKASYTNNNPKVIAGFYTEALKKLKRSPFSLRTDMGTENVYLENIQIYLRQMSEVNSSYPPFLYGTSQANQRIESWWSILRKHNSQFWINLFQSLKDDGHFDGTFLDKCLIQYCFMNIIQKELNQVVLEWNTHPIRKSRNSVLPGGKPIILYSSPELYKAVDCGFTIEDEYIANCAEECLFNQYVCDKDVLDLCDIILSEKDIVLNNDLYDTINLYLFLREEIKSLLED